MEGPMKRALTPAQQQAVASASNDVCVAAAAGSGKTTVLTERFAHLVTARGLDPSSILVVTYTKKAAEQLKDRIGAQLTGMGLDPGDLGFVGTLHSVCLKLLREYAVDAGLDPLFVPIEETAMALAQDECLDELLDEVMAGEAGRYASLWDWMSADRLKETLRNLYERWRALGRPELFAAADEPAAVLASWKKFVREYAGWLTSIDAKAREKYFTELPLPPEAADEDTRIAWLQQFRDALRHFKASAAGKESGGQEWWDAAEDLALRTADARLRPAAERMVELLKKFDLAYGVKKRRASWLDLDDLLDRTRELLAQPDFVARYRTRFCALMVDEYQDINGAQARLLDAMGKNLIVLTVGDARQSIYRFRYAESEHFLRRTQDAADRHVVPLPENHRSHPAILEWVNGVFADREFADGQPFDRLTACRAAGKSVGPRVEWRWFSPQEEKTPREDLIACEAEWVAQRIRALLDDPTAGVKAGDVAILMRTRTHFGVFEDALRRQNTPFHTSGGSGFWDKPEVADLISLLQTVFDRENRIAAAALLRSPFLGLRDDALRRIFSKGEKADWFGGLEEFARSGDGQAKEAAHFLAWFAVLNARHTTLAPSQIIREALDATVFEAMLAGQSDGRRRLANVQKLLDQIVDCERVFGPGIHQLLRYLELVQGLKNREEEASLAGPRADAVRLLTVHGSKGLEFPVVFVAGAGLPPNGRGDEGTFQLTADGKMVTRIFSEHRILEKGGQRYDAWSAEEEEAEDAEGRRLLYVALTRARERLIVTGERIISKNPPKDGALNRPWIQTVLPVCPDPEKSTTFCAKGFAEDPRRFGSARTVPASESAVGTANAGASEVKALLDRLTPKRREYWQTLDLSVSALAEASEEEKPFEQEAVWAEAVPADGDDAPSLLAASSRGNVFHEMLQRADFEVDPETEIRRLMRDFKDRMDASAAVGAEKQLRAFYASHLGKNLKDAAEAGRPIHRELPFLYRVRSTERELGFIRGQADLLFEGTDGRWTLVDYKTGVEGRPEHLNQMKLYVFCLRRLLANRPHRAELYYAKTGKSVPVDLNEIEKPAFESDLIRRYESLKTTILR